MVNQYKNKISSLIKNKYREAKYHDKNFFNDFKIFRETLIKEILRFLIYKILLKRKYSIKKKLSLIIENLKIILI